MGSLKIDDIFVIIIIANKFISLIIKLEVR